MRKLIDYMMTHPLFTGIAGIMVAIFSIKCCNTAGDSLSEGILRMLLVGTMAFFLYFVSREKTLQKCGVETGYVVKVLSPLLITSALLGGLSTVSGFISHVPMQPNWIANFFLTLFEMLFVGLFEEIAFRALINDAIVYRFRTFKHVFLLSAVLSSLIFGYAHVMFVPISSPLMAGQVAGKTISTGLFGLASLFLYWKTRNIWACGLLHGLFDFLISLPGVLFVRQQAQLTSYAVEGPTGILVIVVYAINVIVVYAINILINGIICLVIWRKVGKTLDFEEMRETW